MLRWTPEKIRQYKEEKRKLRDELSKYDNYVPDTHIGMYTFFGMYAKSIRLDGFQRLPETRVQLMREKSFNELAYFKKQYGSPSVGDLWNYNIDALTRLGCNYFATVDFMKPIAHLIQCFEKPMYYYKSKRCNFISFGISKELVERYQHNLQVARETGQPVVLPTITPREPKSREEIIFGTDTIHFTKEDDVTIDWHILYTRFKHLCLAKKRNTRDVLREAVKEYVENHNVKSLNDLDWYGTTTDIDRILFQRQDIRQRREKTIVMPRTLENETQAILRSYNMKSARQITFDDYVANALFSLNKNMKVKYGDPYLREESRQLTEQQKQIGGV